MNLEDQMSIEELRRELRDQWDRHHQFMRDLAELPDVPDYLTLRHLADFHGGYPDLWEIGKAEQREHRGKVPYKTEFEIAQGLWSIIRDALRTHNAALADAPKNLPPTEANADDHLSLITGHKATQG